MIHALFFLAACVSPQGEPESSVHAPDLEAHALPLPPEQGAGGAALPNLTRTEDGRVLLSFVRREGDASALVFCELEGGAWSTPREIARGTNWFVNWADFPSVTAARDGGLLAHWLQVSGAANYAYDVRTSLSSDGGETWSASAILHTDRQPAEHGFVSVAPAGPDGWRALWLDGRQMASGGPMALFSRRIAADGELGPETIVDERVCDCCGTALIALPGQGFASAWRDRSSQGEEVRDVSFARLFPLAAAGEAGVEGDVRITPASTVGNDRWQTRTCPVNGPRLAAGHERVALAWFTGAAERPRVNLAWAPRADHGAPGLALRVDGGVPGSALGRGDLAWTSEHGLCVAWLGMDAEPQKGEQRSADGTDATWWVRGYRFDGEQVQAGEPLALARVSSSRGSGFVRMAPAGGGSVVVAWTAADADAEGRTQVRTALVTIDPQQPGRRAELELGE